MGNSQNIIAQMQMELAEEALRAQNMKNTKDKNVQRQEELVIEMARYIQNERIRGFTGFFIYCAKEKPEWLQVLYNTRLSILIKDFIYEQRTLI